MPYPIAHYVSCDKFSLRHQNFLVVIIADCEPMSFSKPVKDERWREAMQNKIQVLEDNGTWVTKHLPYAKKALDCKWVYKIKHNYDGERFKARLVISGNHQVEGIDYKETFTHIAKMLQ